jgi:KEOPS complex subunit Pcc1
MRPHESELVLDYDSEHRARTVARSVRREIDEIDGDRSAARVARDGAAVTVTVEAADLTALRAGQNTWLSLVEVAERAADAGDRYA